MYFGGVFNSRVVECFFLNFDILKWIIVFLLLKSVFVNVFVNLVLLVLVGFSRKNELIGCFGLFILFCDLIMVFVNIFSVLFCLIILWCRIFFILSNFFFLFDFILLIGIFVEEEIMVVILWEVIFLIFFLVNLCNWLSIFKI